MLCYSQFLLSCLGTSDQNIFACLIKISKKKQATNEINVCKIKINITRETFICLGEPVGRFYVLEVLMVPFLVQLEEAHGPHHSQ